MKILIQLIIQGSCSDSSDSYNKKCRAVSNNCL